MTNGENDPALALGDALDLVFDAIAAAERALRSNPSVEEGRVLNEQLNNLRLRQASIEAQLTAIAAGTLRLPPPSQQLVDRISRLAGEVDALRQGAARASSAVAFGSRVLTVAAEAAGAQSGIG